MSIVELLQHAAAGQGLSAAEQAGVGQWLVGEPSQALCFGLNAENARAIAVERLRRLPAVWQALNAGPLEVAGYAEEVLCDAAEAFCFHIPLGQLLLERAARAPGRYLVAIAGVPAGGKSVFTALMARVLRALRPPFGVATLGLDGYHYPNAYLEAHRTPPGVAVPGSLRLYKGAHFTFNALRLAADLRRLRGGREPLALPAYDRSIHDPVEGAVAIRFEDRLVLVEGNYLLCREHGWDDVAALFDLRLYLELPPGVNRERMVARHVRGGRSREDGDAHFERADRLNTELVASTREWADLTVELDAAYRVKGIWRACVRGEARSTR